MAQNKVYKRILKCKIDSGLTWDEIAAAAKIPISSWMTGVPYSSPTDQELRAIAPVLNTTYDWLKYGRK